MREETIWLGTKEEIFDRIAKDASFRDPDKKDQIFGIKGLKQQLDDVEATGFPGIVFYTIQTPSDINIKETIKTANETETMPQINIKIEKQYVHIRDLDKEIERFKKEWPEANLP